MHCAVQDQHAPGVNNRVASSQGCKNGRKTDHGIYIMFCGLTVFPLRCEVFIVRNRSYWSYFLQKKKGNLYAKYIGCTLPRWTPVRGAAAVVHHGLNLSHISQGHDGYQQSTPPHPSSPTLTHRQRSRLLIGMGLWHSITFCICSLYTRDVVIISARCFNHRCGRADVWKKDRPRQRLMEEWKLDGGHVFCSTLLASLQCCLVELFKQHCTGLWQRRAPLSRVPTAPDPLDGGQPIKIPIND